MKLVYAYLPLPYVKKEIEQIALSDFFVPSSQREHQWQLVARVVDEDVESLDHLAKKYNTLKVKHTKLDNKYAVCIKEDCGEVKKQKVYWSNKGNTISWSGGGWYE